MRVSEMFVLVRTLNHHFRFRRLLLSHNARGCPVVFVMGIKHAYFIARTVLVQKNNAEEALRIVNKHCQKEGIFTQLRKMMRYEKPKMVRRRVNYEKCKALYNEDMTRKIKFLSRRDRKDAYPAS